MDVDRAVETIAAEAPRRLRLSELLAELGACTENEDPASRPESLTLGELIDTAAGAGFGFLIGVLVLIAMPFFGFSTPFGIAMAIMGAQIMIGQTKPWLPRRARRRALKMTMLDRIATILARRTRWIVRATRRRWEPLVSSRLVGVGVFILAVGLALPIPIPGSNWIFLFPLFVYAIGMLERDGMWILAGHILTLANVTLLVVFWQIAWAALTTVVGWFT